jgi:hypothetical protein
MTLGILIPVILLALVVPLGLAWAKKSFKESSGSGGELPEPPSGRLTSSALRDLPTPPWRVVYEIADDKLGGIGHVLIGPAGVFALQTSMEPLPEPAGDEVDPHEIARVAVARGDLDDALGRCAMQSEALVTVHWGASDDDRGPAVDVLLGHIAVDGRHLDEWAASLPADPLTAAQVDLAWQTVLTTIGRPDPLA